MTLRIWHQSFTVLSDLPAYVDALKARIGEVVAPGTQVVLHGQIPNTYPSEYPGTDLAYNFLYRLHELQWAAAAREAERQGYDAMVLASIPSPMIRELRTLVNIPIVGYGETAFNLAGLYGRRVGMLFFNVSRRDFWLEQVRQWGVAERFAGIAAAGVSFDDVVAAHVDPSRLDGVVQTIVANGEKLAQDAGADVIVPGEMPMNLLLAKAGVHKIGGATVIDGIATCFKMAETLVSLQRLAGMSPSRRGYFHAQPDPARVEQVLDFYGLAELGRRIPQA
ncbi:MAG: racemase [Burkholderiales bacterium]|nr:racemase [Burkholderiales bacterium]